MKQHFCNFAFWSHARPTFFLYFSKMLGILQKITSIVEKREMEMTRMKFLPAFMRIFHVFFEYRLTIFQIFQNICIIEKKTKSLEMLAREKSKIFVNIFPSMWRRKRNFWSTFYMLAGQTCFSGFSKFIFTFH